MESVETKAMQHLEHLCAKIGPRPIGSKGNQAAASYIQSVFEASGLGVEVQEFSCPAWEHKGTRLELDGERLDAAANVFSPPCDVVAPAVTMGTVAELDVAELTGLIGIMHGDLTKGALAAKGAVYNPERDQKIVQLLEEKRPAALITVNPRTGCLERLIEDWELPIPSATVPARVGLDLLRQSDRTLHLTIATHRSPGHSCNVVATRAGARRERIVLCAHYDTKIETPGAFDNGAGVAVLLAVAELLAERDLPVGLEWIAFNGEEYGGVGDKEYLRRRGGELEQVLFVINVDGVGQRLGANSITAMASSEPFQAQVSELLKEYPGVVWVDPWPASNHYTFYTRGVPSIAISSVGAANVIHLPTDTIEWISPAKLNEVVSLVTNLVESLQDKSLDWCRESRAE